METWYLSFWEFIGQASFEGLLYLKINLLLLTFP